MAQPYSTVNAPDSALQYLLSTYYDSLLLKQAKEKFVLYNLVDKKPLPKNQGNIIKWSRYTLLGPVNQATIGTAPTPTALSAVNVTATLIQFLGSTTTADVLEMTAIDPQIESAVEQLSYQAANTVDTYIRNVMIGLTGGVSSTNQDVAGPGQSNDSLIRDIPKSLNVNTLSALTVGTHKTTVACISDEAHYLRKLNAPTFEDGFYHGVMHPDIENAIKSDTTAVVSWAAWANSTTAGQEKMERGYIGKIFGVKFWSSTNMWFHNSGTAGASTSAYYTPIFGPGAVGIVDIDGGVKTYVTQGADHSNPAAQWSTIAWKITTAAAVLNPSFGIIMISTT